MLRIRSSARLRPRAGLSADYPRWHCDQVTRSDGKLVSTAIRWLSSLLGQLRVRACGIGGVFDREALGDPAGDAGAPEGIVLAAEPAAHVHDVEVAGGLEGNGGAK